MITRREFVGGLTAATAALAGVPPGQASAEPPPETTTIKLDKRPSICIAPQYVAEELLRTEGFTDVQYVNTEGSIGLRKALNSGEVQMSLHFAGPLIVRVDAGDPIVVVAGAHVGCFELFGTERVRAIRDLKGKTVGEAAKIKNTDIVNELKLPPVKIHCSVLAEDAIKAALADYKDKHAGATASAAT